MKRFCRLALILSILGTSLNAMAAAIELRAGYNIRQEPTTSSRTLGTVQKGTKAKVIFMGAKWALVEINGRRAYVSMKALPSPAPVPSPSTRKTKATSSTVVLPETMIIPPSRPTEVTTEKMNETVAATPSPTASGKTSRVTPSNSTAPTNQALTEPDPARFGGPLDLPEPDPARFGPPLSQEPDPARFALSAIEEVMRERATQTKVDETPETTTAPAEPIWNRVPPKNWAKVDASLLNMRENPNGDARILGQIRRGARVAVIESQLREDGRRWHRILPFDCNEKLIETETEAICDMPTWVSGDYLVRTDAPNANEIAQDIETSAPLMSFAALTEGQVNCEQCLQNVSAGNLETNIADLSDVIRSADTPIAAQVQTSASAGKNLYEQYRNFQKKFLRDYPIRGGKRAWASKHKTVFVTEMIKSLGVEKAAKILTALTAYGEARGASKGKEWENIGELAFVAQIIRNRAKGGYRDSQAGFITQVKGSLKNASLERDLSGSKGAAIRVIFAKAQFSAWNNTDPNLSAMMSAESDKLLERAFRAVSLMDQGQITPVGELGKTTTDHYHAKYVRPSWSKRMRLITAQMKTPGGIVNIKTHKAYNRGGK